MADELQGTIARLKAARNAATAKLPTPAPMPADTVAPSEDAARSNSRDLLRAMGYDDATIESVAPGTDLPNDMAPDSLNGITARTEAAQLVADREAQGFRITDKVREGAEKFLEMHGDEAVAGLSVANRALDAISKKAGEKAAETLETGIANFSLGMAALDIFTKIDNSLKIDLFAPDEKKALMKLYYLPKETLLDPTTGKEFGTASEMALWSIGQKVWGAMNNLASVPPEWLAKAAETVHASDAEAFLRDIARLNRAEAKRAENVVAGTIPQMVAGMAPYAKYQDIFESHFDPQELDDIYAQMDDPGMKGPLTAAAITGIGTLLDFYASPTVALSAVPSRLRQLARTVHGAKRPEKAAEILSDIAHTSSRFDDAQRAKKAAERNVARWEEAVEKSKKPDDLRRLKLAHEALAREEHWMSQFQDPGTYEPMMPRAARRSPAAVPDTPDNLPRKQVLAEGPDTPVDWSEPSGGLTLGTGEQRLILGPDDAEYAGDALNMLARGAEIDDVTAIAGLTPEYYVLPDVQTSLVDIRKLSGANKATSAREAAVTVTGSSEETTARTLLNRQVDELRGQLRIAKSTGDKEAADAIRAKLRQAKKTTGRLDELKDEPFDEAALPAKQPGIMQDPHRFNRWLNVAGNRVERSLYPGGLRIHGWDTKLGQMIGLGREPMRYYMTYAPDAWERLRGGVMRTDRFTRAGYNLAMRELEAAGVLVDRKAFDMTKHYAPQKINQENASKLFKLLNSTTRSENHLALYEAATPEIRRAHDRIRVVLDHFADQQGISGTERYLEGYMRHMFDPSMFKGGARPPEFIGIPGNPELFVSHLFERTGKEGYSEDVVLALDLYMRAAYKKMIMEPVYDDIIRTGEMLAKKHDNTAHITYANDLVNQLKGKPDFVGAKIDEAIGAAWNSGGGVKVPFRDKKILWRPGVIDRTAFGIYSLVHNGLTIGPHYAILQLASGLTTTQARLGPMATMRGLFAMGTKEGQQLAKAAGTYKPFVDFLEAPTVRRFTEAAQTKLKPPPFFMSNQQAENWSRGITMNAAVSMLLKQGGWKTLKEAEDAGYLKRILFEAVRVSEECNHLYGPLGRSPWTSRLLGASGSTAAQQLLSYIPKQTEELLGNTARNPGYILRYLALSGQISRMAANMGIDMTGDVGVGYLPESMTDITSPAVDAALDNLRLLDALDRGDQEGVERYTAALAKGLASLIPGSQVVLSVGKASVRLHEGTVKTGAGKPLYRMQFEVPEGEGVGSELLPTILLQKNLRETLTRRGLEGAAAKDRQFAYNAQRVINDYVDALEAQDEEAAAKLLDELQNTYRVRLASTDPIMRAIEARSIAQTWRNLEGSPNKDAYWRTLRQHGVNLEP